MNIRMAVLLICASLSSISAVQAAAPVYTSKTRFRIPYRFDAIEMQRLGAREIRLYLSTDRGGRWSQALAVSPETGKFDFDAPSDGEYWFAVRTLDSGNRLHPQGNPIDPELKVIVDTTAPELDIQLRQLDGGKVQLSWVASDPNLNLRELRLEYLQPGEANWQTVSILPKSTGETTWTVSQAGVVSVRGTVADLAGNIGKNQNQLRVEMGIAAPRPGVPDLRQPVAETPARFGGDPEHASLVPSVNPIPEPFTAARPMPRAANPLANSGSTVPSSTDFVDSAPQTPTPGISNSFVNDTESSRPDVLSGRYAPVPAAAGPPGSKTRVVNARKFTIGYKLEEVGPSGVSAVELFITEDNGRKWYKYGVDPDNQSPFDVEVPRDGAYGFAIRVRSGAGLAADPPQPGDSPSIVVVCDQAPPQVQTLPPQQGRGESMNKVLIRWKASDDNLHEKPISLAYAADLGGPWQPITAWIPNTGSHVWTVGPGTPPRIYVRVTARDAAGNIAKADTPEPVIVDLTRPTARIVDVEAPGADAFPR